MAGHRTPPALDVRAPAPPGTPPVRAMSVESAERVAAVLRAMADPLRVRILSAVAVSGGGQVTPGQVTGLAELTPATVSHHLRTLREAGILESGRQGATVLYAFAPGMARVVGALLETLALPVTPSAAPDLPEPADVEHQLAGVERRLRLRFPAVDEQIVRRTVRESYTGLSRTARVTRYLPVLAERFAVQRLEDLRRADGAAPRGETPQVLFVCVANAGRSQLAAALLDHYAGGRLVARSAGSSPAPQVHPPVRPHLEQILGPDADRLFPKPLTDDAVRAADVVVTMGCGDVCPVLPGTRYEDWAVGDPALASPEGVGAIREDVDRRVRALVVELLGPDALAEDPHAPHDAVP